jgi:hypothetical protein
MAKPVPDAGSCAPVTVLGEPPDRYTFASRTPGTPCERKREITHPSLRSVIRSIHPEHK